jgi:hypothetical protein
LAADAACPEASGVYLVGYRINPSTKSSLVKNATIGLDVYVNKFLGKPFSEAKKFSFYQRSDTADSLAATAADAMSKGTLSELVLDVANGTKVTLLDSGGTCTDGYFDKVRLAQ